MFKGKIEDEMVPKVNIFILIGLNNNNWSQISG